MSVDWLIRLRADETGLKDLAGNAWTNGIVEKITDSPLMNTSGYAVKIVNNTSLPYSINNASSACDGDFTISLWAKYSNSVWGAALLGGHNDSVYSSVFSCNVYNSDYLTCSVEDTTQGDIFVVPSTAVNISKNVWHHFACTRNGHTGYVFLDGKLIASHICTDSVVRPYMNTSFGYEIGWEVYDATIRSITGYMDDVCLIKGKALWTSDFSPPGGYLLSNANVYMSTEEGTTYAMNNGTFQQVATDWASLTDAEKVVLFKATNHEIPTIEELKTAFSKTNDGYNKFKVLTYLESNDKPACTLTAVPKDQLILPKKLISLRNYEKITGVNITNTVSGSADIKIAVTTNLADYQVYDVATGRWVTIDISTPALMAINAMDVAAIAGIPADAWALLGTDGIGFAYFLSMTATTESCNTDALVLTVDMKGSWNRAVYGTDLTYGYPNNDLLQIELLTSGDYKINYNAGEAQKG